MPEQHLTAHNVKTLHDKLTGDLYTHETWNLIGIAIHRLQAATDDGDFDDLLVEIRPEEGTLILWWSTNEDLDFPITSDHQYVASLSDPVCNVIEKYTDLNMSEARP